MTNNYKMTISRLTVDKLGVKLYDRVSAVIAELVANSYDADAKTVTITAPMGELLANKTGGVLTDKGLVIEIKDDGVGMTPQEVNEFYLVVGKERRRDPKRGGQSKIFKRHVMGRKGVGKLAPFGVCEKVEVITAGGDQISENGKTGYRTAHLILDRSEILKEDTDSVYEPGIGATDNSISATSGTTIRLTIFDHRRVPTMQEFERQLSQRFGISSQVWKIVLVDSTKAASTADKERTVGDFSVEKMAHTEIVFARQKGTAIDSRDLCDYEVKGPEDADLGSVQPGFEHEGNSYPIIGWVAYSKLPYKDDLMAGVRIYCRGKIAAQTHIFNMKAGFTGEYDIRSYLVGELHADWLDEGEDLIRTDRQDILWSHELGQAFERWGQALVKKIGHISREPRKKRSWEAFQEKSDLVNRIEKAFPSSDQKQVRSDCMDIAKMIAQTTREDELDDKDVLDSVVNLSILFGPHLSLDHQLREAAEDSSGSLAVVAGILKMARIAELSSFGKIADDRVRIIARVEALKDDQNAIEADFQSLLEEAPWLINTEWGPITSNQSFDTLKKEFEKFYEKKQARKSF